MASSASGSRAQAAASPTLHNDVMKQLMDAFAVMNGNLSAINGTLTVLSGRVERIEGRLGQLEGHKTGAPGLPTVAPAAVQQMGSRPGAAVEEASAFLQAGLGRLQEAATAAQAENEQLQAEKESLCAALAAIREACQCPILQDFTADMVMASDGEGYDRQAIQQWRQRDNTSPVTREPLQPQLFPNRFARRVFEELQKFGLGQAPGAASSSTDQRQEAAAPAPSDLRTAIERREEAAALRLLRRPHLPGLNDEDQYGLSVLHRAIDSNLPAVAVAILAKPEFSRINAKDRGGWTALHAAAARGYLSVCQSIVNSGNFTELRAPFHGKTASQWANHLGHHEVKTFLQTAEARR